MEEKSAIIGKGEKKKFSLGIWVVVGIIVAGIAVGMATNIPPHNLGEVVNALIKLIDNPGITLEELIENVSHRM